MELEQFQLLKLRHADSHHQVGADSDSDSDSAGRGDKKVGHAQETTTETLQKHRCASASACLSGAACLLRTGERRHSNACVQRFGARADAVLRRVRVLTRMLCYGVLAVPCRAIRVHAHAVP